MPFDDEWLDELANSTGLTPDQLVDVIRRELEPGYAQRIAQERATALLLQHLDDEQRAEYQCSQQFHVTGSRGGRYLITSKREHNVFYVDAQGNSTGQNICYHVRENVPLPDNMLAQKLLLETDEAAFCARRAPQPTELNRGDNDRSTTGMVDVAPGDVSGAVPAATPT